MSGLRRPCWYEWLSSEGAVVVSAASGTQIECPRSLSAEFAVVDEEPPQQSSRCSSITTSPSSAQPSPHQASAFLRHIGDQYGTDARRQWKVLEGDQSERNRGSSPLRQAWL